MSQSNLEIVQQAYQNFQSGNIPAMLAQMDAEVEWQLPKIPNARISGSRRGHDAVKEFFTSLAADQETVLFEPREFVTQDDTVIALGHYAWRVNETGKSFESDFAHVFTLRNGMVTRFRELFDSAAAVEAYRG